ncbi:MAG: FAD-dependent monooxygenase [Rhizobiales bacterium]|nr:FAD-dependent monooxygenase [Hyphomicrobiales bacterium]NRB15179.1 FAD-dependent monooxygenase [Hyphomicrobiales bacterium]
MDIKILNGLTLRPVEIEPMPMFNNKLDYDAVIVGGGHAGLTMAVALAKLGFKLAIISPIKVTAKVTDKGDGRALAISEAPRKMLDLLGIWPRLLGKYQPMHSVHILDGKPGNILQDALLEFDSTQNDDNLAVAHVVESGHLLGAMWDGAQAEDNIDFKIGRKLTSFAVENHFVTVQLDDGQKLTAGLLIAADGRGSFVRQQLGIQTFGWGYGQTAIVCPVSHQKPHHGAAYEHFYPAGPFASLPLPDRAGADDRNGQHQSSLVWAENPKLAAKLMAANDDEFNAEMVKRFGLHLGEVALCGEKFSYPLGLQVAHEYMRPRAVLIGDAAHGIHPIAGQGLNMGLRDIAVLAEVMVEARNLGLDFASHTVLNKYQQWRRFDVLTHAAFADVINRLFSNDLAPVRFVRDLGLKLIDGMAPVKKFFSDEAAAQSGELPTYLKGEFPS